MGAQHAPVEAARIPLGGRRRRAEQHAGRHRAGGLAVARDRGARVRGRPQDLRAGRGRCRLQPGAELPAGVVGQGAPRHSARAGDEPQRGRRAARLGPEAPERVRGDLRAPRPPRHQRAGAGRLHQQRRLRQRLGHQHDARGGARVLVTQGAAAALARVPERDRRGEGPAGLGLLRAPRPARQHGRGGRREPRHGAAAAPAHEARGHRRRAQLARARRGSRRGAGRARGGA